MANTFKKIQTVTVGSGGTSSIDFTNIPQTYTDLKIVLSLRGTRANNISELGIQFNGITTSSYNYRTLRGNGASADSFNGSAGQVYAYGGIHPAASATASVFGSAEIYIPNYTSANNKSFSVDAVQETNGTTAYQILSADIFNNTAAITSIKFYSLDSDNFAEYSSATLYGVADVTAAQNAYATGGIITYDDTYVYHTFPWSGTFTPTRSLNVDYLVVAGGGGGSGVASNGDGAGGGGAGGLRCTVGSTGGGGSLESQLAVTATAYTVTVGAGGNAGAAGTNSGTTGSNSVFASITSNGGGGGGNQSAIGSSGGSGGGSGGSDPARNGGAGTSGQGFAGGSTGTSQGGEPGSGGGGAGVVGSNSAGGAAGAGGAGITTSISGTSTTYAGGGGGSIWSASGGGAGGSGGGGAGGANAAGTAGTANTGGGGGAGSGFNSTARAGGNGGSGIVIVRYAR